ncbi:MAG: septum formation inhibitor Maf [Betaproteobacteria bacterium]|jgi:septum formation protein|nr:MAG: septum formation inhibitor Maf [Betaproteobacteria bacterium]TMH48168.1 MAG: septum formation inhibitor Maf [Betaproteobacteria bacterium]
MIKNPPRTLIYLASRSPRRRELLKQIGVAFEVLVLREHPARGPDVDESQLPAELPGDYVRRVCRAKAEVGWDRVVQRRLRRFPVLAADTVVCVDDKILGKPADPADAARMLRLLSGREHRVLTAVALSFEARTELLVSESRVRFSELAESEVEAYVESGEPTDKAGAYAIQGRAAAFVTELHGSYSGIMGLPLYETAQLIRKFGS